MQVFPRKILATAVLIASMAMLAGCEDKIEATSMPIMKASVQQVTKDMDAMMKDGADIEKFIGDRATMCEGLKARM